MSTMVERWASLRDREALGEALSPDELADARELESMVPEVQSHALQMNELERYLDGKRGEQATASDHQLVLRALSAVQLDSPSPRVQAIDHDRELAHAADPEGPGWIRVLATSLSVGMTVAAALALIFYEPRSVRRAGSAAASVHQGDSTEGAPRVPLAPKVEALLHVRTSDRGARLRREGQVLAAWALLGQSDRVSAEKPGCFVVEGEVELCLAANSAVRLNALSANNVALALERGQVSLHAKSGTTPRRVSLEAGEARVTVDTPSTVVLELGDEGVGTVRARVLRGRVRMTADAQSLDVLERKSGVYRREERSLDVVDLLPGPAQHAWDLVGTGRMGSVVAPMWSGSTEKNRAEPLNVSPELPPDAPRELMQEAWELLKAERWQEAAQVYERIGREAPDSEEAHIVLVRLGGLLLERLADPQGALTAFDRYLREGGGPLAAESRHGRVAVFRRLQRPDDERAAIEEFLRFHEKSTEAPQMQARLKVLTP